MPALIVALYCRSEVSMSSNHTRTSHLRMSQSLRAPEKAWTRWRGKTGARSSQNRLLFETSLSLIILEFGLFISMFVSPFLLSWGLSNISANQGFGLAIVCITMVKRSAKDNLVHKFLDPIVILLIFSVESVKQLLEFHSCLSPACKVESDPIFYPTPTPHSCRGALETTLWTPTYWGFPLNLWRISYTVCITCKKFPRHEAPNGKPETRPDPTIHVLDSKPSAIIVQHRFSRFWRTARAQLARLHVSFTH